MFPWYYATYIIPSIWIYVFLTFFLPKYHDKDHFIGVTIDLVDITNIYYIGSGPYLPKLTPIM